MKNRRNVRLEVVAAALVCGLLAVAFVTFGAIWRDDGERKDTTAAVPTECGEFSCACPTAGPTKIETNVTVSDV